MDDYKQTKLSLSDVDKRIQLFASSLGVSYLRHTNQSVGKIHPNFFLEDQNNKLDSLLDHLGLEILENQTVVRVKKTKTVKSK